MEWSGAQNGMSGPRSQRAKLFLTQPRIAAGIFETFGLLAIALAGDSVKTHAFDQGWTGAGRC